MSKPAYSFDLRSHAFMPQVVAALLTSRFRRPATWSQACVIFDATTRELTLCSRGEAANWFAANDLEPLAHEVFKRTVPPGHLLAWLVGARDGEDFEHFILLRLL